MTYCVVETLSPMEGLEPFIKLFKSQDVTGHIVMGALESARRLLFSTYFPALPDCTLYHYSNRYS